MPDALPKNPFLVALGRASGNLKMPGWTLWNKTGTKVNEPQAVDRLDRASSVALTAGSGR
jgi:hypothetical protein